MGTLIAVLVLACVLFAGPILRFATRKARRIPAPITLPPGCDIRLCDRLVKVLGAPIGGASAVTVGKTIYVPRSTLATMARVSLTVVRDGVSEQMTGYAWWKRLIRHECEHLLQNVRLGPLFVPAYCALFVRYGYKKHPYEVAARKAESNG
jgi:hypothetical protein